MPVSPVSKKRESTHPVFPLCRRSPFRSGELLAAGWWIIVALAREFMSFCRAENSRIYLFQIGGNQGKKSIGTELDAIQVSYVFVNTL